MNLNTKTNSRTKRAPTDRSENGCGLLCCVTESERLAAQKMNEIDQSKRRGRVGRLGELLAGPSP